MDKIKKNRCPHCKGINTVNITKELEEHKNIVYKKHGNKKPDITTPKLIAVICSHCKKSFKTSV